MIGFEDIGNILAYSAVTGEKDHGTAEQCLLEAGR